MRIYLMLTLLVLAGCRKKPELPVIGTVPEFSLIDQSGQPFSSKRLAGKVWIADMIFTNCPGACLRMASQMKRVQTATGDGVRLVSFTVDPDRDQPALMAAYARRYQADAARWTFLTGPREELDKVSTAFLLGKIGLEHSTRFVLVDGQSRLRATYQTDELDAVERLLSDVAGLQGK